MDYIALSCVNCILKREKTIRRMAIVATLASVFGLLLHISIKETTLRMILLHFVLNTAMAVVAFGFKGKKYLLENFMIIYFAILFLGGIMEWEKNIGLPASFFWGKAVFAAVLLSFATYYLMRRKSFLEHIYKIEIVQDGKSHVLKGYWDSGNLLIDPYVGAPVNIVGKEMAALIFAERKEGMRLIPYQSLGCDGGLLPVCNAQKMYIYHGNEKREVERVVLGIAKNELFRGKEYDMILQSTMIEE